MNNLIFRRQFLLTTAKIRIDASWKKNKLVRFQRDCFIYSHPDLEVTSSANANVELFLLGYILDPHHPEFSNQDILDNLLKTRSFDSLAAATDCLTGRFAIVYCSKNTINVFHDATGFREIYYFNNKKEFACGSTPNIIAKYLSIGLDDNKDLNDFFNSPQLNSGERKWIGVKTIYKGIKKLLPNHYVDLVNDKVNRYWPRESFKFVGLKEATQKAAKILTGTYESVLNRYKIEQTITSGWDTRLLLAACKKHIDIIEFYFIRGFKADHGLVDSGDYLISKKISEKYNLRTQYMIIEDIEVDKDFERIYYENNVLARPKLLKVYYTGFLNKLDDVLTVSGTLGNSLLRLQGGLSRSTDQADLIAHKLKYDQFKYVTDSIQEWLDASKEVRKLNYYLLDLFYWEQYLGNWGALSGSEQDIVRDELRPFNNRELISTLGAVHDKYKYRDYPMNYVKTIELLWPELLNFSNDIEHYKIKKALRALNLEQFADRIYQKIKT